jgi:ABC-type transport system involved in multi-copper enzyme maturation permease subunit
MASVLRRVSDLLPTNPIVVRLVSGAGRRSRDLLVRGVTLGALMVLVFFALLGPLFMAGAIAQESNPRTWEILVTTPLSSLQIVLGNLFGRLFFALALLISTLPLCLAARIFGGVRGSSVVASMAVSGCSAIFL